MAHELYRQAVHFSGLAFVILAQFTGKMFAGIYFLLISAFFLLYSWHIKREERRIILFSKLDARIREAALSLERDMGKPFMGAFWFYFSLGIVFLLFPLDIASAAGAILAVGDSLSTIMGLKFGKHKIIGNKTLEGSLAFFTGSLIASYFFVGPVLATLASALATLAELIPALGSLKNLSGRGIINDNWMVPAITAAFMLVAVSA